MATPFAWREWQKLTVVSTFGDHLGYKKRCFGACHSFGYALMWIMPLTVSRDCPVLHAKGVFPGILYSARYSQPYVFVTQAE